MFVLQDYNTYCIIIIFQGEKLLFVLDEGDLISPDFIVFLSEFISSDAISHLFSQEQVTTIVNSIRTDVTQAGLTYSRNVAWQFFLK